MNRTINKTDTGFEVVYESQNPPQSAREYLLEHLRKDHYVIIFTKANGEERKMFATLNLRWIPLDKVPNECRNRKDDSAGDVITVFDTEVKDWRSVNITRILCFYPVCSEGEV